MAACGEAALVGREVTAHGLSARADLNGRVGVVKSLVVAKGRYQVELKAVGDGTRAETIAVKPTNLRLAAALTGRNVRSSHSRATLTRVFLLSPLKGTGRRIMNHVCTRGRP